MQCVCAYVSILIILSYKSYSKSLGWRERIERHIQAAFFFTHLQDFQGVHGRRRSSIWSQSSIFLPGTQRKKERKRKVRHSSSKFDYRALHPVKTRKREKPCLTACWNGGCSQESTGAVLYEFGPIKEADRVPALCLEVFRSPHILYYS